ncbi:MAG: 2-succinyl-5-enolpyruvyl-6-hydroxy-3-cyclohexene-1-carboxylic-acid synthase [Microbacterium sp.]
MTGRAPATDAAAALIGRLVELGVRHVVLSPGSRSQALALVAAELEARGSIALHVRIDERVAGFTALGIGRESAMPAAVVCTSGTATANLLPAVLEAHHAGVPLLLLTADRPPELRGVGANQTTRQPGMFAPNTRLDADVPVPEEVDDGAGEQSAMLRRIAEEAVAAALGAGTRQPGPVHLNLPYREPLGGALPDWLGIPAIALAPPASGPDVFVDEPVEAEPSGALYQGGGGIGESNVPDDADPAPVALEPGPRTIVIAGADAGPAAEALARAGGWPLVAEIVSGARFGPHLVHGYRALLADPALGGRVERAVVFGHPTLSREVVAVLSRPDLDVLAVRGPGEPLGLNGATTAVDAVAAPAPDDDDRQWLGEWMRASRAASVDSEAIQIDAPIDRVGLVDAVWRATAGHDRLMFASSRLVRIADEVLGGKRVSVHANRGLAGIDGTIATGIGIAEAARRAGAPGLTRVVTGDLAFLHDVGALLLAPGEQAPPIQLVVGNDGGGTIFDGLEVARLASPQALRRVLYTPQSVEISQLAAAYGWEYRRVATRTALDQALTTPVAGCLLIEVPLAR